MTADPLHPLWTFLAMYMDMSKFTPEGTRLWGQLQSVDV